jgi:hypothetical protein
LVLASGGDVTQETDLDLRDYVYVVALAPAILVTHAFAVRLGRAVELTGRLQGRSTVNLLSGGLSLLNLGLTTAICRWLDIPLGIDAGAGAIDVALSGVIALFLALVLSLATRTAVRVLPQRRRTGPHQRTNALLASLTTWMKVLLLTFVALFTAVLIIAFVELIASGFEGFGPVEWAALVLVPVLMVILAFYVLRAHRKTSSYAKRLRPSLQNAANGRPRVLYLRPFQEEHRLFAGSQTLAEFLGDVIAEQIGPLIALGNPTDRIAPDGAERHYYEDDEWQSAVERLATEAPCIVAATSASPNTAWELRRVLELGLERRLYLLSPPFRQPAEPTELALAKGGRIRGLLGITRRATISWLAQDWDGLSRELSFGQLPSAMSPAGQATWDEFVSTLVACGYSVDIADPGAGAVVGFETGGTAVLLERGASSPLEFVRPMVDREISAEPPPHRGRPDAQPPI